MLLAPTLALGIALSACSGPPQIGREFDALHIKDIDHGGVDRRQIVKWFGTPERKDALTEGGRCVERDRYQYAEPDKSKVLFVDFDPHGVVCAATYACLGSCTDDDAVPNSWTRSKASANH
jgi:hypothetical protein